MKIVIFFLILLSCFGCPTDAIRQSRFKSIQAFSLDEKFVTFKYCYVRALSRVVAVVNCAGTFHKIIKEELFVKIELEYRYGTIWRSVVNTPNMDWCKSMDSSYSSLFVDALTAAIGDSAPQLFHKCPYQGEIVLTNTTMNDKTWPSVIPSGIYKATFNLSSEETIFARFITKIEIKSDIQTSF